MRLGLICLSGHNLRAVVALCRWADGSGVPLHLVACDAADPIHLTTHRARVALQRPSSTLEVAEVVSWISTVRQRHGHDRLVVMPSTEYFNRFVLRHRAAIEAAGGVVPLVDETLYTRISDKQAFAEMCAAHDIPVPGQQDDLPAALPFVAKPRRYLSGTGRQLKPYLVKSADERDRFLRRESIEDFFFQAFETGRSVYLLAHLARDGRVTATAQENLVQQADGGSIVLARGHEFHRSAEARDYLSMLTGVGFHGLVMIEVRLCERSGRAVMIEANPRMWGPQQFMLARGVDPFAPLLADHGFHDLPPRAAQPADPYYFWSGGLAPGLAGCDFHHFTASDFVADYAAIARSDLFARDDTRALHAHELTQR